MAKVSGMSCSSLSLVMSAIGPSRTTGLINPAKNKTTMLTWHNLTTRKRKMHNSFRCQKIKERTLNLLTFSKSNSFVSWQLVFSCSGSWKITSVTNMHLSYQHRNAPTLAILASQYSTWANFLSYHGAFLKFILAVTKLKIKNQKLLYRMSFTVTTCFSNLHQ